MKERGRNIEKASTVKVSIATAARAAAKATMSTMAKRREELKKGHRFFFHKLGRRPHLARAHGTVLWRQPPRLGKATLAVPDVR